MLGKRSNARKSSTASKKAYKYRKRFKQQTLAEKSNNRIHFIKRHVDYFTFTVPNVTPAQAAWTFRLANVPGLSELTGLYDQYKICGVHMKFFPSQTDSDTLSLVDRARANARFLSAIDYNDATPPSSSDDLRQYTNCEVTSILEVHERYIKNPTYVTNSGQVSSEWLPTSFPNVAWFGLKTFTEPTETTSLSTPVPVFSYRVECIYYLCFKDIK